MRILPLGSAGTDMTFLVPLNSALFRHDNQYHTEYVSWYINCFLFLKSPLRWVGAGPILENKSPVKKFYNLMNTFKSINTSINGYFFCQFLPEICETAFQSDAASHSEAD